MGGEVKTTAERTAQGKTVIAFNPSSNMVAVIVQPDQAANGMGYNTMGKRLAAAGFTYAVRGDGGNSSFALFRQKVEVAQGGYKPNATVAGIGFKIKK